MTTEPPKEVWIDEDFHEYSPDTDQILASTVEGNGFTLKYILADRVELMIKLAVLEEEYIALLENALSRATGLATVHGYGGNMEEYLEGERLRQEIRTIQEQLQ